ncbi:MAG: hypothetical protein ACRDD1_07835, partial [Planctomycetia bacterium]
VRPGGWLAFDALAAGGPATPSPLGGVDKRYRMEELTAELADAGWTVVDRAPVLVARGVQRWAHGRFHGHRPRLADFLVSTCERLFSGSPHEWMVLCRRA